MLIGSALLYRQILKLITLKLNKPVTQECLEQKLTMNYRGINILTKLPKKLLRESEPLEKFVTSLKP